jgi:RNA polymerase sigma-70 factor (ECF subfamily)
LILSPLATTLHGSSMSERDPSAGSAETAAPESGPGASEAMALAREAAAGNGVATGRLLRLLAPRLGGVVRAIMGADHPDRDDAVQLALIGLVQALPAFRGECDPAGYAATIAVRTAVAARKRACVRDARHEVGVEDEPQDPVSPGELAEARVRQDLLRDLLAALPSEQGETLAMRVVLGWSLEEIAAHTRAPVNTVRSRLRLAKEAMRRRIEADDSLREALEVEP